jgi:hypothetical protein
MRLPYLGGTPRTRGNLKRHEIRLFFKQPLGKHYAQASHVSWLPRRAKDSGLTLTVDGTS